MKRNYANIDPVKSIQAFLGRLKAAGLVESFIQNAAGTGEDVKFTERGNRVKAAFQALEKAHNPKTPGKILELLGKFTAASITVTGENRSIAEGMADFVQAMGNVNQNDLVMSWVLFTEKYNVAAN